MEEKEKFTIMEGHELPSGGNVYDVPVNPHVELRPMSGREEMQRTSVSTTPLKTIADIIQRCIVSGKLPVDVYDMCMADYEFLLHKLRIITYGPKYNMTVLCPDCGSRHDIEMDLDTLDIIDYDQEKYDACKNFDLPDSKKKITLRNITPRLEDEIRQKAQEFKKKAKYSGLDTDTLAKLLMVVDKIDDRPLLLEEKFLVITQLTAKDMVCILNKYTALGKCFGIDTRFVVTCPVCEGDFVARFQFGPEFFRPTNV